MAELTWLGVPGSADRWRSLGFDVPDSSFVVDGVHIDIGADALAWRFGDAADVEPAATHPNGVDGIDHVVYAVDDLDAAIAAFEREPGLAVRRRARPRGPDGPEMAFFRAGPAIIEVVDSGVSPRLWGIAFRCPDLDAAVAAGAGHIGEPRPAIQGGRIASVRTEYLGFPVAIMEPKR
jgi:catechol 2,3-dioxygenase-like lactoylglutathione lyase family enzyme